MSVTTWNRDPPPGFRGFDPQLPVTFYYRHLPHWRQDGATYFVTFRLADALPQAKLRELRTFQHQWEQNHGLQRTDWNSVLPQSLVAKVASADDWEAYCREVAKRVEAWLDQGMGACWMQRSDAAQIVADALHHFDDKRYALGCYVIMPNHAHAILRPLEPQTESLEKILQSRKRHTSREINALVGRSGMLWQEESFDRIVRDEEHLYRCIQYIGRNAKYAGLAVEDCPRWIRPSWVERGWKFDDFP
jgi:REP element-mobilizing transposase RayT